MKKVMIVLIVIILLTACAEDDISKDNRIINNEVIQEDESDFAVDDESSTGNSNVSQDDIDQVEEKISVIATKDFVVGGILNGQWTAAIALVDRVGESNYDVYSIEGKLSTVTGGRIVDSLEPGEGIYIPFDENEKFKNAFYLSGSPNTNYREVSELSIHNEIYLNIVKEILIEKHIDSDPVIKRIIKLDMEADGVDEVLIAASNTDISKGIAGEKNEYSFVMLRKIVDNEVKTFYLAEAFYTENPDMENGKFELAFDHDILGVFDLNGDGISEILISGHYYEGEWCEVFEFIDDLPLQVLSYGVGL
ncbi:MAG: hypothetical protein JEZ08_05865 [Clostridiales bacterium]|nr:hypothetical protein [Clostridiales bacterium]